MFLRHSYRGYRIGCYGCIHLKCIKFDTIKKEKRLSLVCNIHGARRRKFVNCTDEINPVKDWFAKNGKS